MEELTFKIDVLMGYSECRSWFEAETMHNGQIMYVGMGSRTDFNKDGFVIAHKCHPTGVVMYLQVDDGKQRPWWKRLFD